MAPVWELAKVVLKVVPWEKWMVGTMVVASVRRWVETTRRVGYSALPIAMVRH
jgi:hypothetical protein